MSTVSEVDRAQTQREVKSLKALRSPDVTSTVEAACSQALEYCMQKMDLATGRAAIEQLRGGDASALGYWRYSVAQQIAGIIGDLDDSVKKVYTYDYDATADDLCFGEVARCSPVHLIVWAERKTQALEAISGILNRALAGSYGQLVGNDAVTHMLDMQVVDDVDVKNRTGYGAVLSSLFNVPSKVWER